MSDTRTLIGWGARDWTEVVATCQGMTAAWSDYEGFHIGSLPTVQPPTSHVWAWSPDGSRLMRVRSDGKQVIVGWLVQPDLSGHGASEKLTALAQLTEQVAVTERDAQPWSREDKRVTMRGDARRDLIWSEVDVETADPVTFMWAKEPAGPTAQETGADLAK